MPQLTTDFDTHEVINQPPVFEDANLFESDLCLKETVAREGGGDAFAQLSQYGRRIGSAEVIDLGR